MNNNYGLNLRPPSFPMDSMSFSRRFRCGLNDLPCFGQEATTVLDPSSTIVVTYGDQTVNTAPYQQDEMAMLKDEDIYELIRTFA